MRHDDDSIVHCYDVNTAGHGDESIAHCYDVNTAGHGRFSCSAGTDSLVASHRAGCGIERRDDFCAPTIVISRFVPRTSK